MAAGAIAGMTGIVLVSLAAPLPVPRRRPPAVALLALVAILPIRIALDYGALWILVFVPGALSIHRHRAPQFPQRPRARLWQVKPTGQGGGTPGRAA